MSLNKEQRRITAEELQANFEESTLSVQMIAEKLNVTTEDVEKVFAMKTPLGILVINYNDLFI